MTIELPDPENSDFSLLYKRILDLKMEELFSEPYDPPEYLEENA